MNPIQKMRKRKEIIDYLLRGLELWCRVNHHRNVAETQFKDVLGSYCRGAVQYCKVNEKLVSETLFKNWGKVQKLLHQYSICVIASKKGKKAK